MFTLDHSYAFAPVVPHFRTSLFDCQAAKLDPYECPSCNFKTYLKVYFDRHWNLVHDPLSGASPHYDLSHLSKIFTCRNCDTATHSKLVHLKHKVLCMEEKSHTCDSCPYVTLVPSKLLQHKFNCHTRLIKVENLEETEERPKGGYRKDEFSCGYCDFKSYRFHTVKAHFVHDHMDDEVPTKQVTASHVGRVIYFRVLPPD